MLSFKELQALIRVIKPLITIDNVTNIDFDYKNKEVKGVYIAFK